MKHFAKIYSTSGKFLSIYGLLTNSYVDQGTIYGGDWYIVNGSMQDWSYMENGCLELTIEISLSNPDSIEGIDRCYDYNIESILTYIESAGIGVYGRVTENDANGNAVPGVKISIAGGDFVTSSNSGGYYHRLLLPGPYVITFSASGYTDVVDNIKVEETGSSVEHNVYLIK